jgi:hypothetical protein
MSIFDNGDTTCRIFEQMVMYQLMQGEITAHARAIRQHGVTSRNSGQLFLQVDLLVIHDRGVIQKPADKANP